MSPSPAKPGESKSAEAPIPGKRITLLCQHFYPEMVSTGMHMTELATRLVELGWEVTVYCAKPSWGRESSGSDRVPKEIVHEGVRVHRVRTVGGQRGSLLSRGLFAISFMVSAGWALQRRRGDSTGLVITTNPPFLGVLGWLCSRLYKWPYLLIVYDVYPEIAIRLGVTSRKSWFARTWSLATRLILSEAAVIVVIGRDMADVVRSKVPAHVRERIVLIPNWTDERRVQPVPRHRNAFRREHGLDESFVVQYAGRFGRTHNVEPLIGAARLLSGTNVLFQFIGDGAKKAKLEMLAVESTVTNVQFLPYQPMERLAKMLSAADLAVVCLGSAFTGLSVPSKAYGIMASGTPLFGLLDPQSEIGRMITETGCGLTLVDPDPQQIATAVQELIANGPRRTAMGKAGRRAFLEKYTLARAAQHYDRVLVAMMNRSAVPSLSLRRESWIGRVGLAGQEGGRSAHRGHLRSAREPDSPRNADRQLGGRG